MRALRSTAAPLAWALVLAATPAAADDADAAYRASIAELLRLTGATQMGEQMANGMFQAIVAGMQQSNPNVPRRALEIAHELAREVFGGMFADEQKLLDLYAPIYREHFTQADVDGLVAFYRSPVGQKAVEHTPAILEAGMAAGQRWAQEAMPGFQRELQRRLEAEGLLP